MRAALLAIGVCVALDGTAGMVAAQARDAPIPHKAGQSVTPSFEGWFKNPDGSFTLSFGYMDRNFWQAQDLPVGDDNRIEPGPIDRGSRHTSSRGVRPVSSPSSCRQTSATAWSPGRLTSGGDTIAIPGHLRPEWEIDALHEVTSGNRPPTLRLAEHGGEGQGPDGPRTTLNATELSATLDVWAHDDGVKKRPSNRPSQLGVVWSKYRGPGAVTFDESRPTLDGAGHAVTEAVFETPGTYVLRVLAWDDSGPQGFIMAGGFQCCWTNGFVEVRVTE